MVPRHPTLIFADKHDDPVKLRVLSKLMPRLKTLGYDSFYDEVPSGYIMAEKGSHEEVLKKFNEVISILFKIFQQLLERLPASLNKAVSQIEPTKFKNTPEDLLLFAEYFEKLLHSVPLNSLDTESRCKLFIFQTNLENFLLKANLISTQQIFLQDLNKYKIAYRGIDDKITIQMMEWDEETITEDKNIELINNTMAIRNKTMSEAYLSATSPVFGRVGLDHIEGIQNEITNRIPKDAASKQFSFLYIHNGQKDFDHLAKLKLPLDIIAIDAKTKTDDEIADFVISKILEKQKILSAEPIAIVSAQALQTQSVFAKETERNTVIVNKCFDNTFKSP